MEYLTITMTFSEEEIQQIAETTGLIIQDDKETLCQAVRQAIEKYIETYRKPFNVLYTDNDGEDCYLGFDTEEEAENDIEEDLNNIKEYHKYDDYDYGDFGTKTEFWISDSDVYASWERLWK